MRLLFIGDTHNDINLDKINESVVKDLGLGSNDIIIHCGDIGIPWDNIEEEAFVYWKNMPCEVIVCLGNHENYDWIESQPMIEKYGVKGNQITDNVFAPKIGSIIELGNKSLWFFPGGYSTDFRRRTLGKSIWKQELPLKSESDKAVKNLKEKGFVDFVVTHDGPRSFIKKYFGYTINDTPDLYLEKTETVRGERVHPGFVLDELYETPELYDYWYFGHHHDDIKGGKLRCLMHDMVLWDLKSNQYQIIKG